MQTLGFISSFVDEVLNHDFAEDPMEKLTTEDNELMMDQSLEIEVQSSIPETKFSLKVNVENG